MYMYLYLYIIIVVAAACTCKTTFILCLSVYKLTQFIVSKVIVTCESYSKVSYSSVCVCVCVCVCE